MKLTDDIIVELNATGKARKIADGGGLHIYLSPSGGKHWRLSYRYNGKQKLLSFGSYPLVSLADARSKKDVAKKLLANGIYPGEVKKGIKGGNPFAAELQFMRDKITEIAYLASKNNLCLEVSIGVRVPETMKGEPELQPMGTFVINYSASDSSSS